MCDEEITCEHPERLNGKKPGDCSSEQQQICHGEVEEHPCEPEPKCQESGECCS